MSYSVKSDENQCTIHLTKTDESMNEATAFLHYTVDKEHHIVIIDVLNVSCSGSEFQSMITTLLDEIIDMERDYLEKGFGVRTTIVPLRNDTDIEETISFFASIGIGYIDRLGLSEEPDSNIGVENEYVDRQLREYMNNLPL